MIKLILFYFLRTKLAANTLFFKFTPKSKLDILENTELDGLDDLLEYPFDQKKVEDYIHQECKIISKDFLNIRNNKIKDIKILLNKYSKKKLFILFKYSNSFRDFKMAQIFLFQIIRKNLSLQSILSTYGVRNYLSTKLLLSAIIKKERKNLIFSAKNIIYLLDLILNSNQNKKFKKFVSKKTISLVGGASSNIASGNKIDSFDIVSRINNPSVKVELQDTLGKRCDIVFLRGERIQFLLKQENSTIRQELEQYWLCLKLPEVINLFKGKKRFSIPTESAFNFGHLNAIQSAAIDLISNGAKKIVIFNVDFNLNPRTFDSYRPTSLPKVNYEQIFGSHPPQIQFLVTKALMQSGFLEGGDYSQKLLGYNYRKFMKKFNKTWGI